MSIIKDLNALLLLFARMVIKILILSDTHCRTVKQLPQKVLEEAMKSDVIIHAGDFTSNDVVEAFRCSKTFYGVHGNMDDLKIKMSLPEAEIITLCGFKIGITHPADGGSPIGIKKRIKGKFNGNVDAVIFGHTHKSEISHKYGILFLNPGSLKSGFLPSPRSYMILQVSEKLEPSLIIV